MRGKALFAGALAAVLLFALGSGDERHEPPKTDSRRALLLEIASADIGPNKDPDVYWREAGAPSLVGSNADWCGGWVLSMLHRAGLGAGIRWIPGKGFFSRLPVTRAPLPGDLVFFEQTDDDASPEQHQAILERLDGALVRTLDGNQDNGGTARRARPRSSVTAFFSIEPLLGGTVLA